MDNLDQVEILLTRAKDCDLAIDQVPARFHKTRHAERQLEHGGLAIAVLVVQHLALLGELDLPARGSRRLSHDGIVSRASAPPDRSAAAVKHPAAYGLSLRDRMNPLLRPVQIPRGGQEATILGRIRITEHHLLTIAAATNEFAVRWLREQGFEHRVDAFEVIERNAAIRTRGVTLPFPFQAHLHGLPPQMVADCLVDFIEASRQPVPDDPDIAFEDWSLAIFGRGISDGFMLPYNEKLFRREASSMTADWVSWAVPRPSLSQVIYGALGIENRGLGYNSTFRYPLQGGIGVLPEALAGRVSNLQTGARVVEVDLAHRTVGLESGERLEYETLVVTTPLPGFLQMARGDNEVAAAGADLDWSVDVEFGSYEAPGWCRELRRVVPVPVCVPLSADTLSMSGRLVWPHRASWEENRSGGERCLDIELVKIRSGVVHDADSIL